MVVLPHRYPIETVINQLKGSATRQLRADDLWHETETPWSRGEWKVFLSTPARVRQTINYAHRNLAQYGREATPYSFLTPLPDWAS